MRGRRGMPEILVLLLAALACAPRAVAQTEGWDAVVESAAGQTVYFNEIGRAHV